MSKTAPPEARRSVAGFREGTKGVIPPVKQDRRGSFLSDVIVELGLTDSDAVEEAVQAARQPGRTVGDVLLKTGALDEEQLAKATAERNGFDYVDLEEFEVDFDAATLISRSAARRYSAVPIAFADDGALIVAIEDPVDALAISDIEVMTKSEVRRAVASPGAIAAVIKRLPDRTAAPQNGPPVVEDEDAAASAPTDQPPPPEPPADVVLNSVPEEDERAVSKGLLPRHNDPTVAPLSDRDELEEQLNRLTEVLEQSRSRQDELRAELARVAADREALQAAMEQEVAERDRLHDALAEAEGERERTSEELAEAKAEQNAAAEAERERLQAELAEAAAERERLQDEITKLEGERDRTSEELAEAEAERNAAAEAEQERMRAELTEATTERERLQTELAEAATERVRLQEQVKQADDERKRAVAELEEGQADQERMRAEVADAKAERDRAWDELAETETERDGLAKQLADSFEGRDLILGEARRLANELTRLQSESPDGDG